MNHYRTLLLALLAAPSLLAQAGEQLHVPAGGEYLIERPVLRLESLRLEDGATLRLAPQLAHLQLVADQAWIGRGVRLLASGEDAPATAAGLAAVTAEPCEDGQAGQDGLPGAAGQPGRDLSIELGLLQFGSLLLDTRGGAGAGGQPGQPGMAGGKADACTGGNGGAGGRGGAGGAGGKGGDVVLRYWSLGEGGHIPVSNFGPGVQLLNEGGQGADGGIGGAGGAGGAGEFSKRGNGIKVYRNAGVPGSAGEAGSDGDDGASGRFIVQPVSRPE